MMAIFRLGSFIPTPGVSYPNVRQCIADTSGASDLLGLANLFSGGALLQLSVFALGIMPYITASIIVQLLRVVIPKFEALHQEGQAGTATLTQYTRYLTIALAILQSTTVITVARNGQLFNNCAVPVIPNTSVWNIAQMVITMTAGWVQWVSNHVASQEAPLHIVLYTALIIFFCYFYTAITFNPDEVADNMKKYGGFIPGIRAGRPTAEYLEYVLSRITAPGSMYLAGVAMIPLATFILLGVGTNVPFGGVSIMIMVGVGIETVKQIESQLQQRHYEGFLR